MRPSHIIWSGQACPFRRAGVYYGLSEIATHELVAHWLLPRRGQAYTRGRIQVRPKASAPLHYFAIRDPSAVRVIPVRAGGRAGKQPPDEEFAHVSLMFPLESRRTHPTPEAAGEGARNGGRGGARPLADLAAAAKMSPPPEQGGFIVTVGLRVERETEFHERLVLAQVDLPYAQLCERIMALRGEFSS